MCQACRNAADREKTARWIAKNPEKAKERQQQYGLKTNEAKRKRWHDDPEYRARAQQSCREYQVRNRELLAAKNRERNRMIRHTVIARYGGRCTCCDEERVEFLVIDHIAGGGSEERRALSPNGVYRKLFNSQQLLPDYRVLCHNCNSAIAYYGYCPHSAAH